MNESILRRVGSGALHQFSATSIGLIAGVVLSVLVARALGPAEMGSYALALMIVTALGSVAGLGLARTALKFAAELSGQSAAPRVIWWLLSRRFASAVLASAALVATAPLLGLLFHDDLLPSLLFVGSGLVLINLLASVFESTLEGSARFDLLARATFWLTPLYVVVTLVALALGGGAARLMLAGLLGGAANLAVLAMFSRRAGVFSWRPPSPEHDLVRRMARFARQGYLLSLLTFVVRDRAEVLVLGALATTREVGLYSVALGAAEASMRLGPWIVATVYFPVLAAAWARADLAEASAQYSRCLRYLVLAAAPLCLGGIAVADVGVRVLFGADYAPMVPVLRLNLVASAAAALAQGPSAILTAAERQDWLLKVRAALAALNLALDFGLVPHFAAVGAAWANLTVAIIEALLLGLVAWRLGMAPPVASLGMAWLAAGVAAVAATQVLAVRTDTLALIAAILVGTVAYAGVLVAVRFFRPDEVEMIAPLLRRLALVTRAR